MNRREFITLLGGAAAWPLAAAPQPAAEVPSIGMLYPGPQAAVAVRVESMLKGVRESGYLSPTQIELVLRAADNDPTRIAPLAADIIKANVDVIFAAANTALQEFRSQQAMVGIVALDHETDPVENGTVASLARPGGTITGVFLAFPDFAAKCLQLLMETLPRLTHVARCGIRPPARCRRRRSSRPLSRSTSRSKYYRYEAWPTSTKHSPRQRGRGQAHCSYSPPRCSAPRRAPSRSWRFAETCRGSLSFPISPGPADCGPTAPICSTCIVRAA